MFLGKSLNNKAGQAIRILTLLIFMIVFLFPQAAGADVISDKRRELDEIQKKINGQSQVLNQKSKERKTLANQVAMMNSQIAQTQYSINKTQAEIDLTEAEISQLILKIKKKQTELAYQKEVLNETLRVVYEETDVSFLEMIFSTNNISEVLDNTEYLGAIEGKISFTMDEINRIKTALAGDKKEQEGKKTELVDKKNEFQEQQNGLSAQRYAKNQILAETRGQEARYRAIVANLEGERANVSDALYRELAKAYQTGNGGGSGTGGYPWANIVQDSMADPWGFLVRECTSYVAWYWNWKLGRPWLRGSGPPGTGDAKNWATILAPRNGYSVYTTPRKGSIAVWEWGTYGHVAIVEKVNNNGTFNVSEYNVIPGQYGERYDLSPTGQRFIDTSR